MICVRSQNSSFYSIYGMATCPRCTMTQGTLDFNFAESIASVPGLAESMGMSGKRKLGFAERYRGGRNNEVSISVSGSSEEEGEGSVESEDGGGGVESHVVNPLFVGELKHAIARRRKNSA